MYPGRQTKKFFEQFPFFFIVFCSINLIIINIFKIPNCLNPIKLKYFRATLILSKGLP